MATTFATAFSFVGSTKRIHGYFGYGKGRDWGSPVMKFTVGALLAFAFVSTLLLAWSGVLSWYLFLGVFFWIAVPWRIIRRNQRRSRHLAEQQLAAQQALVQGFAAQQAQSMPTDHA